MLIFLQLWQNAISIAEKKKLLILLIITFLISVTIDIGTGIGTGQYAKYSVDSYYSIMDLFN